MQTFFRLLEPIKAMKGKYFWYILTSIWLGVNGTIQVYVLTRAIKGMETKDMYMFKTYMFIYLGLLLFLYFSNYFQRTLRKITARMFQQNIYGKYVGLYMSADNNKIEGLGTGQSNSILQKGCDNWRTLVNEIVLSSYIQMIVTFFSACVIFLFTLGFLMLGVFLLVFFVMILLVWRGNMRMRPIRNQRKDVYVQTDRTIIRLIMSKFEILQNSKIAKELTNVKSWFDKMIFWDQKESTGFIISMDIPRALIEFVKYALIFWYGTQIFIGNATFAEFMLIWWMMNMTTGIMFQASESMMQYYEQLPHVQKLRKTFDEIPQIHGYEEGKKFIYKAGDIQLKDVQFTYGDKEVFHALDLSIQGGKKTALVGHSGSGKTTLLKLLSGYIHPTQGMVEVDGQDLSKTALKTYYQNIGYLTQDPNVFDGSIIDNLLYGTKTKPSKKQIDQAIESAKCEFIYDFKDGLETQIGEKGVRLSGGQKQRLAIAKLFLKNPHIIFLDEPTSALDSFSEELITKAFNNLFIGRTVVVAAHRLQTVKSADTILVFGEDGKISEQGNHAELTKKKGQYAKMLELQSGF